jgi:hypothetical protein
LSERLSLFARSIVVIVARVELGEENDVPAIDGRDWRLPGNRHRRWLLADRQRQGVALRHQYLLRRRRDGAPRLQTACSASPVDSSSG